MRLDQALVQLLEGQSLSKGAVRKLIVAGAVYLNGKRVRIASKEVQLGAKIEVYLDRQKLGGSERIRATSAFVLEQDRVLFEDEWLIAIDKPAGIPTQPTLDEARANLYAAAKKFLSAREGVADAYLGLHHRLDRDTSGVILFTKKKEANAGVAALFSKHLAQKTYQAIASRGKKLQTAWTVRNYLKRAPGKAGKMMAVRSGGDLAITEFMLLREVGPAVLIEAKPKTGRMHQIRVHLADSGQAILGDTSYGGPKGARVFLHAACLTFPHPISNLEVSIASPLPEDFQKCLADLENQPGS